MYIWVIFLEQWLSFSSTWFNKSPRNCAQIRQELIYPTTLIFLLTVFNHFSDRDPPVKEYHQPVIYHDSRMLFFSECSINSLLMPPAILHQLGRRCYGFRTKKKPVSIRWRPFTQKSNSMDILFHFNSVPVRQIILNFPRNMTALQGCGLLNQ